MTREDTIKVLSILKTAYPRFYANMSKTEAENVINLWSVMFSADNVEAVELALYKLISICQFPPSVAEMRKALAETQTGYIQDAGEAWGSVINAIRAYGATRENEALESMSEMTRLAVRRMGWANLCMSEDTMADRAHFLKIYGLIEDRQAQLRQMPLPLQEKIEKNIALNVPKEGQARLEKPKEEKTKNGVSMPDSVRRILNDMKNMREV